MSILLIFGLTALFLMGSGIYIWMNNATHLLQNLPNNGVQIRDKKGLSKWAGVFLNIIGLYIFILGLMTWKYAATKYEIVPLVVSIPVMYLMIVLFMVRSQRYIK